MKAEDRNVQTGAMQQSGAAERRRLQNRMNQRAHRQRKASEARANPKACGPSARRKWVVTAPDDFLKKARDGSTEVTTSKKKASSKLSREKEILKKDLRAHTILQKLHDNLCLGLARGSPTADLILSVTQFNIIRAVISNIATMGMSTEEMGNDDTLSPWNMKNPWKLDLATLPPTLRPTELQKLIPHHPWIDPLPLPSVRDALLRRMDDYDDIELCNDMMGECGPSSGRPGLIIWCDPWDSHGFEITESFAQKWIWMFEDCTDLLMSTNHWRRLRGEHPLFAIPSE